MAGPPVDGGVGAGVRRWRAPSDHAIQVVQLRKHLANQVSPFYFMILHVFILPKMPFQLKVYAFLHQSRIAYISMYLSRLLLTSVNYVVVWQFSRWILVVSRFQKHGPQKTLQNRHKNRIRKLKYEISHCTLFSSFNCEN